MQYFGQPYKAACIWLNNNLSHNLLDRLSRQHFRAIHAAIGAYKKKIPRSVLDIICKRATPKEWANYASVSTVITLYNLNNTRLPSILREHGYVNDRRPRKATFPDASKQMIGRQNIKNRLQAMTNLNFDWIQESPKDIIRKRLKEIIFTYGLHWKFELKKTVNY